MSLPLFCIKMCRVGRVCGWQCWFEKEVAAE